MRITGGFLKGRQISFAKGSGIRPTTDKLRSALFSIISDRVVKSIFLDVCCGTGAVGIEAISRGADSVVFVDVDTKNLMKNIPLLHKESYQIIKGDFFKKIPSIEGEIFDIIFIDPPYQKYSLMEILDLFSKYNVLKPEGLLIVEESSKVMSITNGFFLIMDERIYGDNKLIFYEKSKTHW
ncbi:MAG: 16S rRNA (guanine(966)-N(2))-methyltransferase RsmD [Calditerrivibrio sp.]|nr:16S rRNA (guanine(966)-N(2))-methyltransferase RsmD [Calditerrivibrio sp.]